jgi:CRISPR-associated protein Csd2
MNTNAHLHHNLIAVPSGKRATDPVAERHDLVLLFDCAKSNPNGDPDTGNMPRVQPDSLKGLATDVCQKRKIRNFFSQCHPDGSLLASDPLTPGKPPSGYRILIHENAVIQQLMEAAEIEAEARRIFAEDLKQDPKAWDAKKTKKGKGKKAVPEAGEADAPEEVGPADDYKKQATQLALLRAFFDLRAFGGVLSTEGPLKGSFYGQIRGPIQITFAESLDKVLPLDATITRCAVASLNEQQQGASSEDEATNRTMGRKHGIDYGLYRYYIHFSPAFAAKTGFSYYDFDNFLFALVHMFDDDHAAGRHLRLVGLVDFQHHSALGNAPAHKLFDLVQVKGIKFTEEDEKKGLGKKGTFKSSNSEFPQGLYDYSGWAPDGAVYTETNAYGIVTGCTEKEPAPKDGNKAMSNITARSLVWKWNTDEKKQAEEPS